MGHHPIGIQPEGNILFAAEAKNIRNDGLGNLSVLSDALMLELFSWFSVKDVATLARVSKAMYAFCADDVGLWKAFVLEVCRQSPFLHASMHTLCVLCAPRQCLLRCTNVCVCVDGAWA